MSTIGYLSAFFLAFVTVLSAESERGVTRRTVLLAVAVGIAISAMTGYLLPTFGRPTP